MLTFARSQFELSLIQIGGKSKRDHLAELARQTGREIDEEYCPYDFTYLWAWWHDLHQGARETGIDYTHILSWCLLTGVTFSHFELSVMMRIDSIFLTIVAEQQKHHG